MSDEREIAYPQARSIGRNVREARLQSGFSQEAVAEQMRARGFSRWRQSLLNKVEMGDRNLLTGEAPDLAEVLGVTMSDLAAPIGDAVQGIETRIRQVSNELLRVVRNYGHLAGDIAQLQATLRPLIDSSGPSATGDGPVNRKRAEARREVFAPLLDFPVEEALRGWERVRDSDEGKALLELLAGRTGDEGAASTSA